MTKKLTIEHAVCILEQLTPIADDYFAMGDALVEKGFVSATHPSDYLGKLARSEAELELHRKVVIERAKETFANPFFDRFGEHWAQKLVPPYQSKFLEERRNQLREAALSRGEDPECDLWYRTDPCLYISHEMEYEAKRAYRMKWQDELRILRSREIERFLTTTTGRARLNNAQALELVIHTLNQALSNQGFSLNQKLSSKLVPFFTKPLGNGWILCFTFLRNEWGFDGYSYEMVDGVRRITPKSANFHLDLRRETQKGFGLKSVYLPLLVAQMTTLGASDFLIYLDADEMIIGILGYVAMYKLVADRMETVIKNVLEINA